MVVVDLELECPVYESFRVRQIGGMFDVPLAGTAKHKITTDIPDLAAPWQIGLIVGPSGSGKSTLAERLFACSLVPREDWPADRAVIDCLGDLPTKIITGLFVSVGFSSPPSWIKPYPVLSTGEQFRCNLARCLAGAIRDNKNVESEKPPTVVFDEFTSVVDRNVARIGSAAVAKSIREGRVPCRFVAVTCHYDVLPWLAPDWTVDLATGTVDWRRLRRPAIHLEVRRCHRRAWNVFARHHYLSGSLSPTARCYVALWDENPVAFCATIPAIGHQRRWRITRLVTLPDYQGIGVGMQLAECVADIHHAQDHQVTVTASHPGLIGHCKRSLKWRAFNVMTSGSKRNRNDPKKYCGSVGRSVVSFAYVPENGERPE